MEQNEIAKRRPNSPEPGTCGSCDGTGWLMQASAHAGFQEIERCDTCRKYTSDLTAATAYFNQTKRPVCHWLSAILLTIKS
jgi:hypothetical protein